MSIKAVAKSVLPQAAIDLVRRASTPRTSTDHEHTPAQISRHGLFELQRDEANKRFFDLTMGYLWSTGDMSDGDYYEFGICGAGQFRSALAAAHKWGLEKMDFYAFDSFEGLPATGHLAMSEEAFLASVNGQGLFANKVHTIKGFFENTLTTELRNNFVATKRPAVFVNIDCDLHESAVPIFEFIEPLIQPGTVIYLDDFYASFVCGTKQIHGGMWGTARAFWDFAAKSRLRYYPFENAGYWGRSFMAYDPAITSGPPV